MSFLTARLWRSTVCNGVKWKCLRCLFVIPTVQENARAQALLSASCILLNPLPINLPQKHFELCFYDSRAISDEICIAASWLASDSCPKSNQRFQLQHIHWSFQVSVFWRNCWASCIRRCGVPFLSLVSRFPSGKCCFSRSGLDHGRLAYVLTSSICLMPCRFAVMACCWALDPEERPKFQQLVQCLTEFHAALGAYVWNCSRRFDSRIWEKAWHPSAAPCITRTRTRDVYKATLKGESTSSKTLCLRML